MTGSVLSLCDRGEGWCPRGGRFKTGRRRNMEPCAAGRARTACECGRDLRRVEWGCCWWGLAFAGGAMGCWGVGWCAQSNLRRERSLFPRFWGPRVGECRRSPWPLNILQFPFLSKGVRGWDSALRQYLSNYLVPNHLAPCFKMQNLEGRLVGALRQFPQLEFRQEVKSSWSF